MAKRSGSVIPFTLTELLALLFFVLALALGYEAFQRSEAQDVADALQPLNEQGRQELVTMLRRGQTEFPEDFQSLVRSVGSAGAAREELTEFLEKQGMESALADTASVQRLLDSLIVRHLALRERETALQEAAGMGDSVTRVMERVTGEAARLQRRASNLQGQMAYLRERVGNGLDHPPCWADSQGRPEYALRVTLFTDSLRTRAIWPEHRERDARQVSGLNQLAGETITYGRFRRLAQLVLRWSQRQEPECRHFVVIVDSVDGGKEAFKRGLLTVEHYFYKYLSGRNA